MIDPEVLTDHTYSSTVEQFLAEPAVPYKIYGILAAPPCTEFSIAGVGHWNRKDRTNIELLLNAAKTVRACLSLVELYKPMFWALENPAVGRLLFAVPELGKPKLVFDPCDYGDPYTKKTAIWGNFNIPQKERVPPTEGSKMHKKIRDPRLRAITPRGFANAFFKVNP